MMCSYPTSLSFVLASDKLTEASMPNLPSPKLSTGGSQCNIRVPNRKETYAVESTENFRTVSQLRKPRYKNKICIT